MESIQARQLRCLADTGAVELKPITLLVGANSSGKSSFIRIFPLLKQSAESKTLSGLLLNEGDVNFGFFDETIHKHADPSELELEFALKLRKGIHHGASLNSFLTESMDVECKLQYAKRSKDPHYPYLKSIEIRLMGQNPHDSIELIADESGKVLHFRINEYDAIQDVPALKLKIGRGIVPHLSRSLEEESEDDYLDDDTINEVSLFQKKLLFHTSHLFHGKTSHSRILAALREIKVGSVDTMLNSAKNNIPMPWWKGNVSKWDKNNKTYQDLRNLILARHTGDLLISIGLYITELARSIYYFAPVRANVERDYLTRDIGVGSVDPAGLNVAMMLSSFSSKDLESFRKWMKKHFGFDVFPKRVADGARIALRMQENNSNDTFNLADMGFGFSQMLPFLVQIWTISDRELPRGMRLFLSRRHLESAIPINFLVAIEQPELHLHPALQAKIADLFVTTAQISKERGFPVRFFLETHSPTIIERVGALIEAKRIEKEDVQVLLFEKLSSTPNTSTVRSVSYNAEGVLEDWPVGFLSAPYEKLHIEENNEPR